MASDGKGSRVGMLAAGWICLATAGLNWWNIVGVGATFWRVVLASAMTLIGVIVVIRGSRSNGAGRPKSAHIAAQVDNGTDDRE